VAKININPIEVMSSDMPADSTKKIVNSVKNGIHDINRQLDDKVRNRNNIGGRLNSLAEALGGIESKIERIINVSESNAGNYLHADKQVEARANDVAAKLTAVPFSGVLGINNTSGRTSATNNPIYFNNYRGLKPDDLKYNGILFGSPAAKDAYIKNEANRLGNQNSGLPAEINTAWTEFFKDVGVKLFDDTVLKGLPVVGLAFDIWDVGEITVDYFSVAFTGDNSYATGVSLSRLGVKAVDVVAGLIPGVGFVSAPVTGVFDDKMQSDLKSYYKN